MKIKATIEKVPGGMMIIPLLLGVTVNTLFPDANTFFGGFTQALMKGTLPILAVFFFCIGATINLKQAPTVLKKGGVLLFTKVGFAAILGKIASLYLPIDGVKTGFFAGLSVLAIVACMNETNGGLYMALMNQLGRKQDAAAFSIVNIESGPFMTMVTLGITGIATFPWPTLVSTLIPFLLGFTLGNLDPEMKEFLERPIPVLIPFFAFALGNSLNFKIIASTGLLGIFMGICTVILTGSILYFTDRLTGGDGVAGIAASSTAGNAASVPMAVAAANNMFQPVAQSATALIATSVIVTAILTPFVTMYFANKIRGKQKDLSSTTV